MFRNKDPTNNSAYFDTFLFSNEEQVNNNGLFALEQFRFLNYPFS